jgi:hypothetical protein
MKRQVSKMEPGHGYAFGWGESAEKERRGMNGFGVGMAMLLLSGAPLLAQPVLSFTEDSVVASGLTAGGDVVFFGVAREPRELIGRIVDRETVLHDDDGDGVVSWALEVAVPVRSMWAAVDLASGQWGLGTPGEYPLRLLDTETSETKESDGQLNRILVRRDFVELLLVRPGVGAWMAQLFDGDELDRDGAATVSVLAAPADLQPVASSPKAPEVFQPGDVVVVMDPDAMALSATRVEGSVN